MIPAKRIPSPMFPAIATIVQSASLRRSTLMLFLCGITGAATMPFLPVLGVRELGLADATLSLLLFAFSVAGLFAGVGMAIFSDMVSDRRVLLVVTSLAGVIGFGAIYLIPHVAVFVLASLLLITLAGSGYSLVFAMIRVETDHMPSSERAAINAVVRAAFSGAWMLGPALVGLWLANAASVRPAWAFAAAISAVSLMLALSMRRAARQSGPQAQRPGFVSSLMLAAEPKILGRVAAISLITGANVLITILQPLILTQSIGGTLADVGLVAGGCAALEIPFMLVWGSLLRRYDVVTLMVTGSLIYSGFMLLFGFATAPWQIYLLLIPNAFGLAAILSLPLSYFQDLLVERPGLGTALNQMMQFASQSLSALAFAIGAPLIGYSASAFIGVGMALAGVGLLLWIERRP
jgi:SET family sugar efflux transporter-like MFS transporter